MGICGPTKRELREELWEDLGGIIGCWEDPWCMGGGFNVLRFLGERNREGRCIGAMRRFSQIIDDLELKDLPLQGGAFTWSGGLGNQRMARLDRFLIFDEWENFFENVNKRILSKPLSDHFPILLTGGGSIVRGPLPFCFENMWLKAEVSKSLLMIGGKALKLGVPIVL